MSKKQSAAQILDARVRRLEEASADLEREAENWANSDRPSWNIRCERVALRAAARRYANAVRGLARATR